MTILDIEYYDKIYKTYMGECPDIAKYSILDKLLIDYNKEMSKHKGDIQFQKEFYAFVNKWKKEGKIHKITYDTCFENYRNVNINDLNITLTFNIYNDFMSGHVELLVRLSVLPDSKLVEIENRLFSLIEKNEYNGKKVNIKYYED